MRFYVPNMDSSNSEDKENEDQNMKNEDGDNITDDADKITPAKVFNMEI